MAHFRLVVWVAFAVGPAFAGLSKDCVQIIKQQQKPALFAYGMHFGQAPGPIVPVIRNGAVYLRALDRSAKKIIDQKLPVPCSLAVVAAPNRVTLASLPFDSADLNGDGNADAVLVDSGTNTSFVLLARGETEFLDPVAYRTGALPAAVILADVNGDGRPDLIVANQGNGGPDAGGISVRLGNGDGTFRDSFSYPAGNAPVTISAADLNGDGKLDVVTGNTGGVSVLLGNGDGTFRIPINYAAGGLPVSLLATDVNGDAKADVAVLINPSNTIALFLGNGDGTLQTPVNIPAGLSAGAGFLARADLNRDGKADFAIVHRDTNTFSILLGNGDGTFRTTVSFVGGIAPETVAFVDLEGNGVLDAVMPDAATTSALILSNNGDGTFAAPPLYPVGKSADVLTIADFNGDGKPDAAVIDSQGDTVSIWLGGGSDMFKLSGTYTVKTSQTGFAMAPKGLTAADLNADGKLDLVIVNQKGNLVATFLGNGDGTFRSAVHYGAGSNPGFVAIADWNGDGKPDLTVANGANLDNLGAGNLSILLGRGDGTFQSPLNSPAGLHPISMAVSDFNRDGRADLAVANAGEPGSKAGSVSILTGNGDGTFQVPVDYSVPGNPVNMIAADFNGDRRLDLVLTSTEAGSSFLMILIANSDGTFRQTRVPIPAGSQLTTVGDLDGDGKPDLLVAHCCGNSDVSMLRGNGDGTFQNEVRFAGGPSPDAIAVADLNGDGRPDLIIANQPGFLTALLNQPAFSPPFTNVSTATSQPGAVAPESLVTAFGLRLATATMASPGNLLTTSLAGTSVAVQDALGIKRVAPLYYVSPGQVNYVLPSATASGQGAVTITAGDGTSGIVPLQVAAVAPGLFARNSAGLAAANLLRVLANGTQVADVVAQLDASGQWVAKPIDLGSDAEQLVLILYGTGIRFRSSLAAVKATIGGVDAPVLYAGDQLQYAGLDQVNVSIPRSLRGRGTVDLVLTVDGKVANTLRIVIQ
jgi:uncharacterized protein (TIGR03437 family)